VSVAFSPDGTKLAAAANTVQLWDVATATRHPFQEALRRDSFVSSVAFSPDGKTVATGGKTVRLWDVERRQPIGEPLHSETAGWITSLAFSPDGKTLAMAMIFDSTVWLWDVNPDSWISRICERVNRNLSPSEWREHIGENVPYIPYCPMLPGDGQTGGRER
jgi:WD40 repeat protein